MQLQMAADYIASIENKAIATTLLAVKSTAQKQTYLT